MTVTIGLAAGGSGGHFFPAEALATELVARGHRVVIYTDSRGEKYAGRLQTTELVTLPASAILPGSVGKLKTLWTVLKATRLARRHMRQHDIAGLVAFGGYPSFAPALACWSLRRPLILHEQATKLSLANRKLLPIATRIATSFPVVLGLEDCTADKIVETGNPVRSAIIAQRDAPYQEPCDTSLIRLLVVGGSQSAKIFGEVVPPALLQLPDSLRRRVHLSLQYNGSDAGTITDTLAAAGITAEIAPFFTDMAERLAEAQLVICRAGASTAAELLVVGRPAIFVPIPQGGSRLEQLKNAQILEHVGVGWCMPQTELILETLSQHLAVLLSEPDTLHKAAAAAYSLGKPQAAVNLADLIENILNS